MHDAVEIMISYYRDREREREYHFVTLRKLQQKNN